LETKTERGRKAAAGEGEKKQGRRERERKAAAGEGEKKQGRRERETKVEEHTQGHLRSI
jgi:hypothetical protein